MRPQININGPADILDLTQAAIHTSSCQPSRPVLGICLGQQSTMRATSGSLLDIAAGASLRGCLLMLLISLLSAAASVYTEWVMNHSQYSHETLNLQVSSGLSAPGFAFQLPYKEAN
jgi:gamma-glutamyl-gamma-aminobutyrate hydrolase PuuD